MDRYRLIASIVVLFIYCLSMFPVQTIVVTVLLLISYFAIRSLNATENDMSPEAVNRRTALKAANLFLAPYKDIWRNLRLSNKFCSIRLGTNGYTITAKETIGNSSRSFIVTKTDIYTRDELWNMFCLNFYHNTSFDGLVELCKTFQAEIEISGEKSVSADKKSQPKKETNIVPEKEKLDVNNASEIELTALPGISIVMAKKLVKRREEIGGFKTVNDVFIFLHMKPHMQTQLEKLICVKKMKGSLQIKRYNERNVDI